jgi:hypothetical protein
MLGWRLIVPVLPLAACAVAMGWSGIAARWVARPRWLAPLLLVALVPLAAWTQSDVRAAFDQIVTIRARGYREGHRALAEWLRGGAARPGDTVALTFAGGMGLQSVVRFHWNGNGESYWLMGEAMGREMVKLLGAK